MAEEETLFYLVAAFAGLVLIYFLAGRMSRKKHQGRLIRDLRKVDRMSGPQFEEWCAALLRKHGFNPVRVVGGSGDQGMDLVAIRHGKKWLVQCKRYRKPVGNKAVQEAYAGKTYHHCQKAAVMSNTTFTPGAVNLAKATGVLLWDRETLERLLKKGKLF